MKNFLLKLKEWFTKLSLGKIWNFKLSIKEVVDHLNELDGDKDGNLTTFEIIKAVIKLADKKYFSSVKAE